MTGMLVIVQGFLLAISAALTWDQPTPLTVGCTVLVGSMFVVSLVREHAEWRR